MVNASALFEAVIAKQMKLDYYEKIIKTLRTTDVSKNEDFQKTYNTFYVVRRNTEFRKAYYSKMESIKNTGADFEDILRYLYGVKGSVEASFASKMAATVNPNLPIWDSIVMKHLGLKLTGKTREEKLDNAVKIYDQICQ